MGEEGNCRQGFGVEIQMRLLGRPRCRWEDNIKVYVKKIVREGVKCIDLTKNGDRQWVLVNTVVNFRIP